jgi:hypothetical protein
MERDEILILEESMDDSIGPCMVCCWVVFGLFRG